MAKLPNYLTATESQRKKGDKGEEKARATLNSGALWFNKADARYEDCLVEVKTTEKKGYRISKDLLDKIMNEATTIKKKPLLIIEMDDYELVVEIRVRTK